MKMRFGYSEKHIMPGPAILLVFASYLASCSQVDAPATQSENTVTDCRDNIDNDDDGNVDCADDECAAMAFCANPGDTAEYSTNGGDVSQDVSGDSSAVGQDTDPTGDGGGDTSGGVVIGEIELSVDEDVVVGELSDDELRDVCSDVYAAVEPGLMGVADDLNNYMCNAVGISTVSGMLSRNVSDSELVATCEEAVSQCESDEMFTEDFSESLSEDAFCADAATTFDNCSVPAGELSDCLVALFNVQFAAFEAYMDQMPQCSELTVETLGSMNDISDMEDIDPPAICVNVESQCPELLAEFN